MKLIILAAGKGTRFLPITEKIPKALIPILGKPIVEYTLDLCVPYISGIVFVVNDILGFKIKEHFGKDYKGVPVEYAIQSHDYPKGTFSALECASAFIDTEKFVICNCDDLYSKEDIDNAFLQKEYGVGISSSFMPWFYHGVEIDNGYIKNFKYHNKSEDLVKDDFINGFYILSKKVFSFCPVKIKNGEVGLPHTIFSNLDTLPLKALFFNEWVAVDGPTNILNAENFIKKHFD